MSLARRLIGIGAAVVGAALTVAACGGDDDALTIYSGRSDNLIGPLLEQFTSDTGIEVKVRYGGSAELAATILEEGGNSPADVFFAQDAGALGALAGKGRLPAAARLAARKGRAELPRRGSPMGRRVGPRACPHLQHGPYKRVGLARLRLRLHRCGVARARRLGAPETAPSRRSSPLCASRRAKASPGTGWRRCERTGRAPTSTTPPSSRPSSLARSRSGLVNHYYLYPFLEEQGSGFKARNYFFSNGDIGGLINVAGAGILDSAENVTDARRFIDYLLSPGRSALLRRRDVRVSPGRGHADLAGAAAALDAAAAEPRPEPAE